MRLASVGLSEPHVPADALPRKLTQSPTETAPRRPKNVGGDELLDALVAENWAIAATARRLGISKTSLYRRIDEHPDIRKASDLSDEEIAASRRQFGDDLTAAASHLKVSPRGLRLRFSALS